MPATHTLSLMAIFLPARDPDVAPLIEHLQYQALSRLSEAGGRNPASRGYFTANVGSANWSRRRYDASHRPWGCGRRQIVAAEIVGVGGGEGELTFRGKRYPFTVSVGFTIGAPTTKLVGRALNLSSPASFEGTFSVIGACGAVAAGAGGVQLQNANGMILQLSGPKVGAEVSAAVGGVTVLLK
jgi:hypothetical protein